MNDRRRETRTAGDHLQAIEVRVRPGWRVTLVNLSASGALVEGQRPLSPGARVMVQMQWDRSRASVSARVVRCLVAAIHAEKGVTYRAGLSFEEPFGRCSEASARHGYRVHERIAITREARGDELPKGDRLHEPLVEVPMK